MHTFFKGLGGVCLGALTGAGLGAALFFAAEVVLPKQVDAAPAHTVAKTLKHEPMLSARKTILEANRHLIANGWSPAPEKCQRRRSGACPLLRLKAFRPVPARTLASAVLITAEICSGCRW